MFNIQDAEKLITCKKCMCDGCIRAKNHFGQHTVSLVAKMSLSMREVWGLPPESVKLDTVSPSTHHRCDVSSELSHAKPWRWALPLVARFGAISLG